MGFKKGDKVTCITNEHNKIKRGETYTVYSSSGASIRLEGWGYLRWNVRDFIKASEEREVKKSTSSQTLSVDQKITVLSLFNEGGDRAIKIVPGHIEAIEAIEKYPNFSGWVDARDRFGSPAEYKDALSPIQAHHFTVKDVLNDGVLISIT